MQPFWVQLVCVSIAELQCTGSPWWDAAIAALQHYGSRPTVAQQDEDWSGEVRPAYCGVFQYLTSRIFDQALQMSPDHCFHVRLPHAWPWRRVCNVLVAPAITVMSYMLIRNTLISFIVRSLRVAGIVPAKSGSGSGSGFRSVSLQL